MKSSSALPNSLKNFFQAIWVALLAALSSQVVQNQLLAILKTKAVEYVVKSLFKAAGFKAWLLTHIVEEVVEIGDDKVIEPIFRKIGYVKNVNRGEITFRKVIDAETIDEWVDAIRDV